MYRGERLAWWRSSRQNISQLSECFLVWFGYNHISSDGGEGFKLQLLITETDHGKVVFLSHKSWGQANVQKGRLCCTSNTALLCLDSSVLAGRQDNTDGECVAMFYSAGCNLPLLLSSPSLFTPLVVSSVPDEEQYSTGAGIFIRMFQRYCLPPRFLNRRMLKSFSGRRETYSWNGWLLLRLRARFVKIIPRTKTRIKAIFSF